MIKWCLSLLLISALVAEAQQMSGLQRTQMASPIAAVETANNTTQSAGAADNSTAPPSQQSNPSPPPKKSPPKNPEDVKRPPIEASMVGYIDNAIVGSEARVRFDAAFNDAFPDRAEFVYAKCGCYRAGPDPKAPGPGPGIPDYINFQTLSFMGEYAPLPRLSFFAEMPVRWLQPEGVIPPTLSQAFASSSGIGDVQAGVKLAALASPKTYVTAQLKGYFPSGDAGSGLGTHHYSLEPSILYYQKFSERFELQGELGGWLPVGGSSAAGVPASSSSGFAGNIFFYGIGPSYRVYDGEQFKLSPVIELVGWSVTGGDQTGPGTPSGASGTNIVNLKMGARMSFPDRNSVYVGYGRALTSADWYDQIVRVEYRHAF